MQFELNEDIIQKGTQRATRYLAEAGTAVPAGNFYEALARFYNYPSWNVMAAALKTAKPIATPSPATQKLPQLSQLRKRAEKALENFDFSELYDGAIVVGRDGWEWEGLSNCSCAVYLELEEDEDAEPSVDSTKVTFTVSFDKTGRVDEIHAS